jgi:NTE family protein
MAFKINGEKKRIGLALSGGGFRAAAYHLGVFKKLDEMDLLWKVDLLTCVSGGSIAGGFLAANWKKKDALQKLETYLSSKSIAVSSVLGGIFDPFHTRLEKLADTYDRDLFKKAKLETLKSGPRIYFNATNLSTGNMFFFVAGGNGKTELGEHELGVSETSKISISQAVAASSAFPPVFPPFRLGQELFKSTTVDYNTLTDGGVYDNLGVNPLLRKKRNTIDYAIVSDGGAPFEIDQEPTESGTIVLVKAFGILMEQVRGLQFQRLRLAYAAGEGPKPLWFSIDSPEGEKQAGDTAFASSIKTNLTRLNKAEMDTLMRHGGALLESRIKKYAPELLAAG